MARVLVYEPYGPARELLGHVLERRGFDITLLSSAAECERALRLGFEAIILPDHREEVQRILPRRGKAFAYILTGDRSSWEDCESPSVRIVPLPVTPAELAAQLEVDIGLDESGFAHAPVDGLTADLAGWPLQMDQMRATYGEELEGALTQLRTKCADPNGLAEAEANLAGELRKGAGAYGFSSAARECALIERMLRQVSAGVSVETRDRVAKNAIIAIDRALDTIAEDGASNATKAVAPILFVDGDQAFRSFAESVANDNLLSIEPAADPETALRLASEFRIAGAIIDLSSRRDEAIRLANDLRGMASDIPIVFVSSDDSLTTRVAAAQILGSRFLTKPVAATDLSEAMRDVANPQGKEPVTVLLVGDSEYKGVSRALEEIGFETRRLDEPSKLFQVLASARPEMLVLCGASLDGANSLDVCRAVRAAPGYAEIPIAIATPNAAPQIRSACFAAGADEHFTNADRFDRDVEMRLRQILNRIRALQERADRDSLTGLFRRQAMQRIASARLSEAARSGTSVALAMIDLDHFKWVNDTHGHASGDVVLVNLARLLETRLRTEDLQARWGGEEFLVLFPRQSALLARRIITRILSAFRAQTFLGPSGDSFQLTFSAGIASAPEDGSTLEELLRAADRRLYRAKSRGRNRVEAPVRQQSSFSTDLPTRVERA